MKELQSLLLTRSPDGAASVLLQLLDLFRHAPSSALERAVVGVGPERKNAVRAEAYGAWGGCSRFYAACLARQLQRPLFFLTAHVPDADQAQDDLETFLEHPVYLVPAAEVHEEDLDPVSEIAGERLRVCQLLQNAPSDLVLTASAQAVMQPLPRQQFIHEQSLFIATVSSSRRHSGQHSPQQIAAWLTDHGFSHVDQVDAVGDFALRGGIVDIFAPAQDFPVRIEFFGDEIESIRFFDLDTQRSLRSLDHVSVVGCHALTQAEHTTSLFDYLPGNAIVAIEEPNEVTELGRIYLDRLAHPRGFFTIETVLSAAQRFDTIYFSRFRMNLAENAVNLGAQSVQRFENQLVGGLDELARIAQDHHVFLFCENPGQHQRVTEILQTDVDLLDPDQRHRDLKKLPYVETQPSRPLPSCLHLPLGVVHQGFTLADPELIVISHHEVFGQTHRRRRIRRTQSTQAIDTFTDLEKGDLVVHVAHGIGRFLGTKTIIKNGRHEEFLAIEYANKAILHVAARNIDLVHKYVGAVSGKTNLSKLGGQTWNRQKEKVEQAVQDLAQSLIDIQAQRQVSPGIPYPGDTIWQREFEDAFPYQETDDQNTGAVDIKKDMQQSRPMDRLLCGDVGYGKTELAMRAVFKAVEYGKQVAVLVPTTVLAEQHFRTFCQRMVDYPFIVESLSRFKTPKQARDIVNRTAMGQVDVVIGTHRLLSKDVTFKDLGLIIIDEEQRFGVEHKERLKQVRATVDILTMTATPIPRTLHLALLGIRDISSLTTPPLDRRSIVTEVCAYDKHRIQQAVIREMGREGQLYYVHNRVQTIQSTAAELQSLVPQARIIVGHGQMPKHELEKVMLKFVRYEADILVCTTIIESGLDIPNANTIIIDNADRFGLAELHQLRGRVGRYKNRAYAYMLLPRKRTINPTAVKRLKAIEEYSQLGSGFRIAMRDLEIRGAGNILGFEQSGHIEAVGYELYCRLLAAAVRRIKGQPEPPRAAAHLEFNIASNIPRSYIAADRQRLDVYRRLATCQTAADLEQLEKDLVDLFGKPPRAVSEMLNLAELRILAAPWPIDSIVESKPDLIFKISNPSRAQALFADAPGSVRVPDPHTIHIRLSDNYFDSHSTLFAVLRRFLSKKPS